MIFLFREANSDTCARKNKYEADYDKAVEEFTRKYGEWGEGLKSEEEKTRERKEGLYTMYGLSDVPEYREIDELHHAEFLEIEKYRNEYKNVIGFNDDYTYYNDFYRSMMNLTLCVR